MSTPSTQSTEKKKKTFHQCKDCPLIPSKTKTVAKVGMVTTLGISAASGILKFKGARPLHLWASIAFIGFTAVHYAVSKKPERTTR